MSYKHFLVWPSSFDLEGGPQGKKSDHIKRFPAHNYGISRWALAREGDYEMMPVCACVR